MTEASKKAMWWLLGMEKVRGRRWGGKRAAPVQEALGIISITTCVFLPSHLFVCLSVSIPLAKPISTQVNEAGQIGPPFSLHPQPLNSPITLGVPQRGHQKPSTRPEALAGADCALGVLSPLHSPQKVATFMLTWQRKKLRH